MLVPASTEVLSVWRHPEGFVYRNVQRFIIGQIMLYWYKEEKKRAFSFTCMHDEKEMSVFRTLPLPTGMKLEKVMELASRIDHIADFSLRMTTEEEIETKLQQVIDLYIAFGFANVPTVDQMLSLTRLIAKMNQTLCQAAMASRALSESPL